MDKKKLTPQELEENLAHFSGTDTWHRWSVLYPKFVLSDGAQYLADHGGKDGGTAYWLMDIIGSYQHKLLRSGREETFQTWKLMKTDKGGCVVTCGDGNGHELIHQVVEYTDFALSEFSLFAIWDGEHLGIRLKGEY